MALFAAVLVTASAALPTFTASGGSSVSLRSMLMTQMPPLLAVLMATWIMARVEHRPVSTYGLGGRRKSLLFVAGVGWGIVCISLLIFLLWKMGLLVMDGRTLAGGGSATYGAGWLLAFLLTGLLEEYVTRGYLLYTLARGLASVYEWMFKSRHRGALGFWTAALLLSILFGLGHARNPGESPTGLLSASLASLVFCLSLWRTGSLWWAIGFHSVWDWAQSFVFGVADSGRMARQHLLNTHPQGTPILSGGTTGPEGSIFILGILAGMVLIVIFTLPGGRKGQARREGEITAVRSW